jgi:hypothetical protein
MDDIQDVDDGRGGLRAHVPRIDAPPDLARRVRSTLRGRGLVATNRRGAVRAAIWTGLVAAGFMIGFSARGRLEPNSATSTGGSRPPGQYVLLLYGDPPDDTGAVHIAREKEYGRWASTLPGGARWVAGHELADVVDDIGPREGAVSRGDRLAGYFVIDAPSRERAAEVARSCPHVRYGGRIVVMAIAS